MQRVTAVTDVRTGVRSARAAGRRVALVPTLGALHDGHLANVRLAGDHADVVVVSVFVNPTQFGPGEDYDAYPRDLAKDEAALAGLGDATPDYVFAPGVTEVYPGELVTTVTVAASLAGVLCGVSRPGHFDAVATVVTKLVNMVQPDVLVLGRKDYQQLQVIHRLVADLDMAVEVVAGPTVRAADGVALSTRNGYLDDGQRRAARALPQALRAAVTAARDARARARAPDPMRVRAAAAAVLAAEPALRMDYVEVRDALTLAPVPGATVDPMVVAVAAHVGPARLIDNVVVGDPGDEQRLLDATDGGTA